MKVLCYNSEYSAIYDTFMLMWIWVMIISTFKIKYEIKSKVYNLTNNILSQSQSKCLVSIIYKVFSLVVNYQISSSPLWIILVILRPQLPPIMSNTILGNKFNYSILELSLSNIYWNSIFIISIAIHKLKYFLLSYLFLIFYLHQWTSK